MNQDEALLKIKDLIEELIKTSKEDRDRSLNTYYFIKEMVEDVDAKKYDENPASTLPYGPPKRKNPAQLLEQLNHSLELSIKSNDNLVKIVDVLSKLKTGQRDNEVQSAEDEVSKMRAFIINEVKKHDNQLPSVTK